MATKKTDKSADSATADHDATREAAVEAKRQRRLDATTVDGTESFPPPGMDLADGGVVPVEDDAS